MILHLGSDHFIVLKDILVDHLRNVLVNPPIFLDISGPRAEPCPGPQIQEILGWANQILETIEPATGTGWPVKRPCFFWHLVFTIFYKIPEKHGHV